MHVVLDRINFIDEFHLKEVILLDDEFLDRLGESFVIFDTCISQFFSLAVDIQTRKRLIIPKVIFERKVLIIEIDLVSIDIDLTEVPNLLIRLTYDTNQEVQ